MHVLLAFSLSRVWHTCFADAGGAETRRVEPTGAHAGRPEDGAGRAGDGRQSRTPLRALQIEGDTHAPCRQRHLHRPVSHEMASCVAFVLNSTYYVRGLVQRRSHVVFCEQSDMRLSVTFCKSASERKGGTSEWGWVPAELCS